MSNDQRRAYAREWRKNNPDKVREYQRRWRENHPSTAEIQRRKEAAYCNALIEKWDGMTPSERRKERARIKSKLAEIYHAEPCETVHEQQERASPDGAYLK